MIYIHIYIMIYIYIYIYHFIIFFKTRSSMREMKVIFLQFFSEDDITCLVEFEEI